ncbi:MAG TPA: amidohydrolase, partial [Gammaproteobacteria bacterium]|nr:amidohydrolase [Gammaproteobacteria bacterium]
MISNEELKAQACAAIDARHDDIISIGETILRNPETGFREFKTERLVAETMQNVGLEIQSGLAITGVKSKLTGSN